jgi:shikimate dehydrogenase
LAGLSFMKLYGLIGNPLSHSFSARYFTSKFEKENIRGCSYLNFQLERIEEFTQLISTHPDLRGLNVTIPFKKKILSYLDIVTEVPAACESVNCIKIRRVSGKRVLAGFNTDVEAFRESLVPYIALRHRSALIFGTGGAASAVALALDQMKITHKFVSRNPHHDNQIEYKAIDRSLLEKNLILINATPFGTYLNVNYFPDIPYRFITPDHILFDLVYYPEITLFLKKGKERGAQIKNGMEMLILQAEKSWEIWNS